LKILPFKERNNGNIFAYLCGIVRPDHDYSKLPLISMYLA